MPKNTYKVRLTDWEEVHQLPGAWPLDKLQQVLTLLEYDDPVTPEELPDMALMLLQDMGPRLATELVLQIVLGQRMSPGVRQNIAEDLQKNRPWEEHPVIDQQAGIFESVVLLQRAFPTRFGTPDAVRLTVELQATDPMGSQRLRTGVDPLLLLRLLAAGMDAGAVVNRLYSEELATDGFTGAADILWRIEQTGVSESEKGVMRHVHKRWRVRRWGLGGRVCPGRRVGE